MTQVWMIRHGHPESGWGDTISDPGLDALGHAQAEQVAVDLLALPLPPRQIVSSPLRRCLETAAPLARRLGVKVEIEAAVGEIPTPDTLQPNARPAWLKAAFTSQWSAIPGGRDYDLWRQSVAAALCQHAGKAVFSHFVAINAAMATAKTSPDVLQFRPDHVSVTVFDVAEAGLTLIRAGRDAATGVL